MAQEEQKQPLHKVPRIRQLQPEAFRPIGQRRDGLPDTADSHPVENHETESTESTPLPSPRNVVRIVSNMQQEAALDQETMSQAHYIRNLMTGEELDLRDENDERFPKRFAELVNREQFGEAIEEY